MYMLENVLLGLVFVGKTQTERKKREQFRVMGAETE